MPFCCLSLFVFISNPFLCFCVFLHVSFCQEVSSFYLARSLLALFLARFSGMFSGRLLAEFLALFPARFFPSGLSPGCFGDCFYHAAGMATIVKIHT